MTFAVFCSGRAQVHQHLKAGFVLAKEKNCLIRDLRVTITGHFTLVSVLDIHTHPIKRMLIGICLQFVSSFFLPNRLA